MTQPQPPHQSWQPPSGPQYPQQQQPYPPQQPPYPGQQGYPHQGGGQWGAPPQPQWAMPGPAFSAPQPGIIPLRPLTVGELFQGTIQAIRANPVVMFGLSMAVMAVIAVISAVLDYFQGNALLALLEDPVGSYDDTLTYMAATISSLVVNALGNSLMTGLAAALLSGMLSVAVSESVLGYMTSISETWERIKPNIWSLLGTIVLSGLATGGPWLLLMAPVGAFVYAAQADGSFYGPAFLIGLLSLIAASLLSIFFTIRLLYAPTVVVLEGQNPIAALGRSWALTRKAFWATFGRYMLISIVISIASSVVGSMLGLITGIAGAATAVSLTMALTTFVSTLLMGFITPLLAAFLTLMYLDQRMRTEGLATTLIRTAESR